MVKPQQRGDAIAIFLFVLLFRGTLCFFPPSAGLINVDELEATLAGADRWLGVPSSVLAWPAGVTQVLVQLFILPGFLVNVAMAHESITSIAFARFIASIYLEPASLITAVRFMGVGISAAGLACLYLTSRAMNLSRTSGFCTTLFWLFSPISVEYSMMATGDGVAWSLAMVSILVLVKWPRRVAIAGMVLGCAAASKITVSSLVVLHVGLIVLQPRDDGYRNLVKVVALVGGAAAGFILLCPQVWIEPVRFSKAVLGNFLLANVDAREALPLLNRAVPPTLLAAILLLGTVTIVLGPQRWRTTIPLLVASALMTLPLVAGTMTYLRYAVPVMIPLTVLAGIAYEDLFARKGDIARAMGSAAIVVTCAGLAWLMFDDQRNLRIASQLRPLLAELDACRSNHRTVLLPLDFYTTRFWRLPANQETWQSALPRAARDVVGSVEAAAFLTKRGLPAEVVQVFWSSFTEREQAYFARLRALASLDQPEGCRLIFYLRRQDDYARRSPLYEMEEEDAAKLFVNNPGRFILVTQTVPSEWRGSLQKFGVWHVLGSR